VVLAPTTYDGGLVIEEAYMHDNEAVTRYLYGGVERMRANIATSQAAYAEARKRTDRSLAPARMSLAQAIKQRRVLEF
jgi:hypothetical protein